MDLDNQNNEHPMGKQLEYEIAMALIGIQSPFSRSNMVLGIL